MRRLAIALLLVAGLLIGLLAGHWSAATRATAEPQPAAIVGSWIVRMGSPSGVFPIDDNPAGFVTFTVDGSAIFSPADPAQPTEHGVWVARADLGEQTFEFTLVYAQGSMIGPGLVLAETKATINIATDGERWHGAGGIFASDGTHGDFWWVAERIRLPAGT